MCETFRPNTMVWSCNIERVHCLFMKIHYYQNVINKVLLYKRNLECGKQTIYSAFNIPYKFVGNMCNFAWAILD